MHRLFTVVGLGIIAAILAVPSTAVNGRNFYVDFGLNTYQTTLSGWNNDSGAPLTRPSSSINLVDSTGVPSGVVLATQFSDPNSNTAGVSDPAQNYQGPYPWTFPPYPISALEDGFYVKGGQQLTITLQSLNPRGIYDFDFYSGTKCCLGVTDFSLVGDNSSGGNIPHTNYNAYYGMTIYGIYPDSSNQIRITVFGESADGYVGGQINLMSFVENIRQVQRDYNLDHTVDAEDYAVWRATYGSNNLDADGDGDGAVNAGDYVTWRHPYFVPTGAGTSGDLHEVPEPACVNILLAAMVTSVSLRRRSG